MAGFFDKIGEFFSNTTEELGKKAKDFVSTSKLEGEIAMEEDKIRKTLLQIGSEYFEAFKDDASSPFAKLIEAVNASKLKVDDLKKEVEKLKGQQRCPVCGAVVSIDNPFCPKCGAKMPEKVEEVVEEAVEEVKEAVEEVVDEVKDAE
ncbi:MAG: zinc ribbon domain-containing protein [Firmicutes bacterium]|nr:zinc ribbon domain-containing protein [Bacillota bacterium]